MPGDLVSDYRNSTPHFLIKVRGFHSIRPISNTLFFFSGQQTIRHVCVLHRWDHLKATVISNNLGIVEWSVFK